ncbi:DUF418 domain-containing protein [Brevundimonas sp. SH203]|uniref:DUF418 domain-containing protein n=1 Tax=Brevundimonas sp. SH203 TaxID=345167 RepID=UPI00190ECE50|nr:DUF418 domain-containing protein [Brevundimonas sp. SH203]
MADAARSGLDVTLGLIVSGVFELKFYLLFSVLFGYSLTLQMQSAAKARASFFPRILRRQAGLFVIGLMHAVLFFHGDILTTYALLGLVLLVFYKVQDRWLIAGAVILIVLTACLWLALAALQAQAPSTTDPVLIEQTARRAATAYRDSPASIMRQHLSDLAEFAPLLMMLQAPCAFAMFLIGFMLGRRRFLETPQSYQPTLRISLLVGLLIGLPGAAAYAVATQFLPGTAWETAALGLSILTAPLLSLAMASGLFLIFDSGRMGAAIQYLASAGRMALSNYLMQSVACALIFHGYGLRLLNHMGLAQVLTLAVAIYVAQLALSRWWLKRWRYGPVEWLLRAVTISGWPQWRLDAAQKT